MATRTIANAGGNWGTAGTWVEGAVPTSADDVVATATSGNVTINVAASCRSIDLTGYVGTLTHGAGNQVTVGNATAPPSNYAVKFPTSGWTYTLGDVSTSQFSFQGDSNTVKLVDFGGKTVATLIFFTNAGTTHKLTGNGFTQASTASVSVSSASTFDTNNINFTAGTFSLLSTSSSTFGTSSITVTSAWAGNASGTTLSAASSTITFTGGATFNTYTGHTYGTVVFTVASGAGPVLTTLSCANFTVNGPAAQTGTVSLSGNLTVSGTFTVNSSSAANRALIASNTKGTARTISAGTVSINYADFRDITGAGAGTWTGTKVGDCGGNSGITFTASANRYWVGNGGNYDDTAHWSATSGGSSGASAPLPQDDVYFDSNSFSAGSQTVTAGGTISRLGRSIDFTGVTNSPTWAFSGTSRRAIYGSLTLVSAMTVSQSGGGPDYAGRAGPYTITTAGKDMVGIGSSQVDAVTGVYQLGDNYTSSAGSSPLTLVSGTLDGNGYNVTLSAGSFNASNSNTRTLTLGSGTWSVGLASGTAWNIGTSTGLTLNAGTSTIAITDAGSSNKTFAGGGKTYNNVTITGGGSGVVIVSGSNTFNVFTINAPKSVRFTISTTQTVTSFVAVGTAGNVITIDSTTAGSAATLSKASGTVASDYLSLKDSTVTGGASWYAGSHSTNVSGNTGWSFTDAPVSKTDGDTATAVEAATITATLTGADTATAVDAGTLAAANTATDTASAIEAQALTATATGIDTATAVDAEAISATLADVDTATAVDAETVGATLAATDVASAVDAEAVAATLTGTDTATAVDAESLDAGSPAVTDIYSADTATATELAAVEASVSGTETATGTEDSFLSLASAETATAVDDAGTVEIVAVVEPKSDGDTGTGLDAESLSALAYATDAAIAAELESLFVELFDGDSATATDNATVYDPNAAAGTFSTVTTGNTFSVLATCEGNFS